MSADYYSNIWYFNIQHTEDLIKSANQSTKDILM